MDWEKARELSREHKKHWHQQCFALWKKLRASHRGKSFQSSNGKSEIALAFIHSMNFPDFCRRITNCPNEPVFPNKTDAARFTENLDSLGKWAEKQFRKIENAHNDVLRKIRKQNKEFFQDAKLKKNRFHGRARQDHIRKKKMVAAWEERESEDYTYGLNFIRSESCNEIIRTIVVLIVAPLWWSEHINQCRDILNFLHRRLADLVAACPFDIPIDTTLADKENRFIFPVVGVAASSEQHAFSLLSVRLSMIEKLPTHCFVLAASTTHGDRHYAEFSM